MAAPDAVQLQDQAGGRALTEGRPEAGAWRKETSEVPGGEFGPVWGWT